MKIVIACKYVKRSFGGAEKVIFDLSNILLDLGHEVTICHHEQTNKEVTYEINKNVKFKNSFGLGKNLFTSKFNKNIENFCFDNLPNDINEGEVFYYLKLNKSFREELASSILTENPDLVIAFLPHTFTHILIQLSKIVPIFVPLQNSPKEDFFNLESGCFCSSSHSKYVIGGDLVVAFKKLLGTNFEALNDLTIPNSLRVKVLRVLIDYFNLHLQGFGKIKSVDILHEIFR